MRYADPVPFLGTVKSRQASSIILLVFLSSVYIQSGTVTQTDPEVVRTSSFVVRVLESSAGGQIL
jgi:hypothetical protein